MKKKLLKRCLMGAPIGLSINYIIALIISVMMNRGAFYPAAPQLTQLCGNELNAVIVQTIVSLLYGAVWAGSTVIWEMESWSLLQQTVIHCTVISLTSFPIAYGMYWMQHSFWGIAGYVLIFFAIYFFIWCSQYLAMKKRVRELNDKVKNDFIAQ